MNDPKTQSEQASIPGTDGQPNATTLTDTQLDEISDSMLDELSGGVTSYGPS